MITQSVVKEDGTVTVKVPTSLKGKKVKLVLKETSDAKSILQWNAIYKIIQKADEIKLPKRTNKEIIEELKTFREA